jgi:hypothetical protein
MLTDEWRTQHPVAPPYAPRIEYKIGAQASDNTRYLDPGAIRAAFEC